MGKYLLDFVTIALQDYMDAFFDLKVKGLDKVKGNHVLYAANHCSNMDPPLIGTLIYAQLSKTLNLEDSYKKQPYFIAKKDLFKWPFDSFLKGLKAVPYNRNFARDYNYFTELLKQHSVVIFPHGGTKRQSAGPLAGHLALETRVNVLPIKIEHHSKWKFKIIFGDEFRPEGEERMEVSQNIMDVIYSLS